MAQGGLEPKERLDSAVVRGAPPSRGAHDGSITETGKKPGRLGWKKNAKRERCDGGSMVLAQGRLGGSQKERTWVVLYGKVPSLKTNGS